MNPTYVQDAQQVALWVVNLARGVNPYGDQPVPPLAIAQRLLLPDYQNNSEIVLALQEVEDLVGQSRSEEDAPQTSQDGFALASYPAVQQLFPDIGFNCFDGTLPALGQVDTPMTSSEPPLGYRDLPLPYMGGHLVGLEGGDTIPTITPGVLTLSTIGAEDSLYSNTPQPQRIELSSPPATEPDNQHELRQKVNKTNRDREKVDNYLRTGIYNHPEVHQEWVGKYKALQVVSLLIKLPEVLLGLNWQQKLNCEDERVRLKAVRVVIQSIRIEDRPMGSRQSHTNYIPALAALLYIKFCSTRQQDTLKQWRGKVRKVYEDVQETLETRILR